MPIRIDNDLPAKAALEEENVFVMDKERACTQDIRPLKIAILNLMPNKLDTELHLLRSLSNTPLQLDITFLQTESYVPTHVSESHMEKFYNYFSEIKDKRFDGLIITGAPVELKEFEEVDYWDEVVEIMEWSKTHVTSTLYICWAAQAGLYYHYGIKKHILNKKISGVYEHHPLHNKLPIIRGFDDKFYVPHSRNTGVDGEAIRKRGLNPDIPKNYYKDDDPTKKPVKSWRCHANAMYYNWLNYYVYQVTPYDLEKDK